MNLHFALCPLPFHDWSSDYVILLAQWYKYCGALYKVITAAIALKMDHPVLMLEREGLPIVIYASFAAFSNGGSTHCIALSRETGIVLWRALIASWGTSMRQSSAGALGTVNACRGVWPDMLGFVLWYRILWLFQYSTNLSSWCWRICGQIQLNSCLCVRYFNYEVGRSE